MGIWRIYYVPAIEFAPGKRKLIQLFVPEDRAHILDDARTNWIDIDETVPQMLPVLRDVKSKWNKRNIHGHPKYYLDADGELAWDDTWIWVLEDDNAQG